MPKFRSFVKYWLPVLLWMGLIFSASSDPSSLQHSSRLIDPLVRWLFPAISADTLAQVVLIIRKCAHMTEYGILAGLFWRALSRPVPLDSRAWRWSEAGFALALTACYAATDEFHQTFVPSRQGSIWDVGIDVVGAGMALGLIWILGRGRRWKRENQKSQAEIPIKSKNGTHDS